jgi:mannose-6-phosphate isomerase-like protein (cupin superfamily)
MSDGLVVRSTEGTPYSKGPSLWKAGARNTDGRFDFLVMELKYLDGPGLHVHDVQDDTFYVLEGILAVQLGDEILDLGPGDFASAPPGVPHTFANLREDQPPVRVINLMTPGGYEGYFAEFEELDESAVDAAKVQEVGDRYGVVYVGPPLRETLGLAPE